MDHHGASLGYNNAYSPFCSAILPLGSNTAVSDTLKVAGNLMYKLVALEDSIVSVVALDGITVLKTHSLKAVLGIDGV
jgi:hypothetical protein